MICALSIFASEDDVSDFWGVANENLLFTFIKGISTPPRDTKEIFGSRNIGGQGGETQAKVLLGGLPASTLLRKRTCPYSVSVVTHGILK